MPAAGDGDDPAGSLLPELLAEARRAGFLGPGPIAPQLRHADGFVSVARRLFEGATPAAPRVADLGSGGGLPGLVVAARWPEARLVLIEANGRRSAFLRRAVEQMGWTGRVEVAHERAEAVGRDASRRGAFELALARSFGRPAVVAECAAPLLAVGGWLVVSEPPAEGAPEESGGGGSARWPREALGMFGLEPAELAHQEFDYQVLRQFEACPERFPRRDGVPAKKPLF